MLEKIKKLIQSGLDKLPKLKRTGGNLWLTYAAIGLLLGTILMYIGTWVYFTFWLYKAGLAELREIIVILVGAPFITALSLLSKGTVDKDGNGIADEDENEQEAENNGGSNKKNHFR